MPNYVGFRVKQTDDIVLWDGSSIRVIGYDPYGFAAYLNSEDVLYQIPPGHQPGHTLENPKPLIHYGWRRGRIETEETFSSAIRKYALSKAISIKWLLRKDIEMLDLPEPLVYPLPL